MQYRRLGHTGLTVSLLGLASGGASRLGQRYDLPASESARLVRHALETGVNFIDTAPGYGRSEELLGQALSGVARREYVLCTKFQLQAAAGIFRSASELRASLERSLRALRTDFVDVFYLHGVGFNLMSLAAVTSILPLAAERGVGIVVMCAVRSVLINPTWQLDEHTPTVASAAYKFATVQPARTAERVG